MPLLLRLSLQHLHSMSIVCAGRRCSGRIEMFMRSCCLMWTGNLQLPCCRHRLSQAQMAMSVRSTHCLNPTAREQCRWRTLPSHPLGCCLCRQCLRRRQWRRRRCCNQSLRRCQTGCRTLVVYKLHWQVQQAAAPQVQLPATCTADTVVLHCLSCHTPAGPKQCCRHPQLPSTYKCIMDIVSTIQTECCRCDVWGVSAHVGDTDAVIHDQGRQHDVPDDACRYCAGAVMAAVCPEWCMGATARRLCTVRAPLHHKWL